VNRGKKFSILCLYIFCNMKYFQLYHFQPFQNCLWSMNLKLLCLLLNICMISYFTRGCCLFSQENLILYIHICVYSPSAWFVTNLFYCFKIFHNRLAMINWYESRSLSLIIFTWFTNLTPLGLATQEMLTSVCLFEIDRESMITCIFAGIKQLAFNRVIFRYQNITPNT